MLRVVLAAGVVVAAILASTPLAGQQRPLVPLQANGLRIAPFFDGWYANPDGTVTFSFGYSNLNRDAVEVPQGPDNFIEPKQYDGSQPTFFAADTTGGDDGGGGRTDRRGRERGVFTVTVPAGFQESVVWTLTVNGQTNKVPASAKSGSYQLRWPMALGSIPPLLRFSPEGPAGRGPTGIRANPMQTRVGAPLSLSVWITDDSVRGEDPLPVKPKEIKPPINVTWYKHSGPGPVVFSPAKESLAQLNGTTTTSATFAEPGEYVIRARADNFGRIDTSPGNQCCWTNGYVKVTVTR